MRKSTTKKFIKSAISVHGNKYDYTLVEYCGSKSKIKIICKKHGIFMQRPNDHLNGHGCYFCGKILNNQNKNLTTKNFIKRAKSVHNDVYDYSFVKYIDSKTPVKIICEKHGVFKQIPNNHLNGHRCSYCYPRKKRKDSEKFIQDANIIHNDNYDYSLVNYVGSKIKIKIKCKKHGVFEQTPNSHLQGQGCPKCSESKGEKQIRNFLNENGINYVQEKTFNNCKNERNLKFDFYLFEKNILIEFDGIQHFKPKECFGGIIGYQKTKENDAIKNNFVKENNIKLIRIRYSENIENKLTELLM